MISCMRIPIKFLASISRIVEKHSFWAFDVNCCFFNVFDGELDESNDQAS